MDRPDADPVVVDDVDPTSAMVAEAHRRYAAELTRRFPSGFDPGGLTADARRYVPPAGACVGAWLGRRFVGTVALAPLAPRDERDDVELPLGEVKRMWVADDARGHGLGRRLLVAIEDRARAAGYATLRLDTNEVLVAAIRLYLSAGYRPVGRYNDNPYATHFMERSLLR